MPGGYVHDDADEPLRRALPARARRAPSSPSRCGSVSSSACSIAASTAASELDQVLLTIGLIFMSVAAAHISSGGRGAAVQPPRWLSGQLDLGFRSFPTYRSFLIVCGAVLVIAAVARRRAHALGRDGARRGRQPRMAQSVGINTSRLFMLTFALGSGLAGLGGALGADILAISPSYPLEHLVYFLIVVAVGGLGSMRGPFVAALLIGIADTAFKYLLPEFGAFFIYALTMALLLWRPLGLFGRA